MSRPRILFVDDEEVLLNGLRRAMRSKRSEWDLVFHTSGSAGLDEISRAPVDIVVSDMRMPAMDGPEFLARVRTACPGAVRIVLSGHSDGEATVKVTGVAHQYLAKPCEPAELVATVERALVLRGALGSPDLEALVGRLDQLPAEPELHVALTDALTRQGSSTDAVADLVERDPAVAASVLKLANSAFYRRGDPVTDVHVAVRLLGLDTVRPIVLQTEMLTWASSAAALVTLRHIWDRNARTVSAAREIAAAAALPSAERDRVFLSSILLEIGNLLLAATLPAESARIDAMRQLGNRAPAEIERQVLGATQGQLGGYLLGLWHLPGPIVEDVTAHQEPWLLEPNSFGVRGVLYAASLAAATGPGGKIPPANQEYLASCGIGPRWEELLAAGRGALEVR